MNPKLLIVDDDEEIRTQMKWALARDYDILLAEDRPGALEQFNAGKTLEQVIGQVTPDSIACYLYSPNLPAPDLIIRTSGEIRLSGFLLWQSAYSEFHFTDVYWPEFRRIDFLRAIRAYQQRHRRYGQ